MLELRSPLLKKLKQYRPVDADDRKQAEKIVVFVEGNPNCFEQSNLAGHITGSAWLVDSSGKRVLLTHHKKLGQWLQLGGHADGNPDVLAVAIREAQEESGIKNIQPVSEDIFDVDVHFIPERGSEPAHFHYDVRFALCADENEFVVSSESHNLAWIEIDRVQELTTEESLLRMSRKWAAKKTVASVSNFGENGNHAIH